MHEIRTNKQLVAFARRIKEMKRLIKEGELSLPLVMGGLERILDGRFSVCDFSIPFPPLLLTLGSHGSARAYKEAIEKAGGHVSNWANMTMNSSEFSVSPKQVRIKLEFPLVSDLGFTEGATLRKIYSRAKEIGHGLCPAETGPALRLAYNDQPNGGKLSVATEPIKSGARNTTIFVLDSEAGELYLHCTKYYPGKFFGPQHRFAFASKR